ncbi:MAG: hypothetical protein JJU29_12030 [Verrucomicrobia bacterium]|nr:hypothetical protein [Verrucomicrobiota bacterium]
MHCQYALAGMHELGLCCDSEEEYMAGYRAANEMATRWWTMAAMQGLGPALDNLVTSGVGEEAERVRELCRRLEKDRPDLVGTSQGMPIYGPAFFQELHAKVFGPLKTR